MHDKLLEYHNFFNNIYVSAENLLQELLNKSYKASLNSYNNHYISINGVHINQKYYMPVISIENKGDICFNIDGIGFEFYISKEELVSNKKINKLINDYPNEINIYEFKECTVDVYIKGDDIGKLLEKVNNSKDNKFGISIDCVSFSDKDIINHFDNICDLLNFN